MKIVVAMPYFFPHIGGVEMHVNTILKGLVNRYNHEVIVITSRYDKSLPEYEVINGIKVYRLDISFTLANTPIGLNWYNKIKKIVMKESPDLINGRGPSPYISDIASLVAKKLKLPFVLGWHYPSMIKGNLIFDILISIYENVIFQFTLKNSKSIICSSKNVKETLLSHVKDKVTVITQGIDSEIYRIKNAKRKKHSILFVGNFELTVKGVIYLLKAIKIVKDKYSDVKLTIAGPITNNKYQEYCEREGIANNVEFVGSKKSSQLSDLYNETEIFVCPSTNENFPSTLLEAMHCGTPVIATKIGNVPQLIKDGVNGQLVEIEDEVGIANAILKYFFDINFKDEMGSKGFESVIGKFDWNSKIEKTNNIFINAIS